MKQRCLNPNDEHYKRYGGRGITVYPAWIHDFQAFYDYVSKLPHFGEKGYSIDRIDNNGNYEPGNVRWADRRTQAQNKRNIVTVEYAGVVMPILQAAELSGISYTTLLRRFHRGDTGEYRLYERGFNLPEDCRSLKEHEHTRLQILQTPAKPFRSSKSLRDGHNRVSSKDTDAVSYR